MKREIKFRGRSIVDGTWQYGHLCWIATYNVVIRTSAGQDRTCVPGTEGEFTGLRDKNGKEIYEGDVVLTSGFQNPMSGEIENDIAVVRYRGPFIVYEFLGSSESSSLEELIGWRTNVDEDAEVIGNIHENPELLS